MLKNYKGLLAALGEGNIYCSLYLDYRKAFDRVNHKLLLSKVGRLGLGGRLLKC